MSVVALIPARSGSKGIPGKNFRPFAGGPCLTWRACLSAMDAGIRGVYVSSEVQPPIPCGAGWFPRPADLAQDDTPMYQVVCHAADTLHWADDDMIVLLQPTQPFRTPERVRQAIQLLNDSHADSVVSVVPLPLTHSPDMVGFIYGGKLRAWNEQGWPTRRQLTEPVYIRDGTVYCFWRKTLASGTIYGSDCRPLIVDPAETCELDTEADWRAVEARWKAAHNI